MSHWIETYPHKVYVSVLLYEDKIFNYKIGERYWESPFHVSFKYQSPPDDLDKLKVEHTYFKVNNSEEHNKAFREWASDWFRQWEVHKDFLGISPY